MARYVFNQPSPSLQFARYTDWFYPYVESLKHQTLKQVNNAATMLDYHRSRLEQIERILELRERLEAIFEPWIQEQKTKID